MFERSKNDNFTFSMLQKEYTQAPQIAFNHTYENYIMNYVLNYYMA